MPNPENHYEDLPSTPPRAKQGDIQKEAKRTKPAKLGIMLPKLNMHTHKVDQRAVDEALGIDREVHRDGFGGFHKQ